MPDPPSRPAREPALSLRALHDLVVRLRAPDGCPWDRKQTLDSVRAYLLEEAHEAAAALDLAVLDAGARDALVEELGDLLFQVVFVGVLLDEQSDARGGPDGHALDEAVAAIHAKMVERHPHVFGDEDQRGENAPRDAAAVARAWESRKAATRGDASLLAGVPASLPSLVGAYRLTQKAAGVGFDWPDVDGVLDKVREELAEVEAERTRPGDEEDDQDASRTRAERLEDEVGDLLFAVANLARHLGVDPESALARCNLKFRRRFAYVEERLGARDIALEDAGLEAMDALWNEAKEMERSSD